MPDSQSDLPRPEHPRPHFFREDWASLNGEWHFKADSGDWLDLEPVYTVDDIRLAQGEILATQGKRKFIRKGDTWVPANPVPWQARQGSEEVTQAKCPRT